MKKALAIFTVLAVAVLFVGSFSTAFANGVGSSNIPNIQHEHGQATATHSATAPTKTTKAPAMDCCHAMAANTACSTCCTKGMK